MEYAYSWALSVVSRALEKHARASEAFIKITGLSPRILARILQKGRPEWPQLRLILQIMDNWTRASPRIKWNYTDVKLLYSINTVKMEKGLREYLTARLEQQRIKEQESGGSTPPDVLAGNPLVPSRES